MPSRTSTIAAARATPALKRVLLIDDSAVARAALRRMLAGSGRFDVHAAADVPAALAWLAKERADAILLDLDMPHTSGIEGLPALLEAGGGAPIVVVSGLAERGAAVTMRALALGAADTLVKPAAGLDTGFAARLVSRLDGLLAERTTASPAAPRGNGELDEFDAVGIGASTGGIHALSALLSALPRDMEQPIFVTQHLPSAFTAVFAQQLAHAAGRSCRIAERRTRVQPGEIVVAPGDAHLLPVRLPDGGVSIQLSDAPSATGNMPSVDPMFDALADAYGRRLVCVMLSGMGRDGLTGARKVRRAGGAVLAQDRDSCVVWGMPGAVAQAGLAGAVLPPDALGRMIAARARTGARA